MTELSQSICFGIGVWLLAWGIMLRHEYNKTLDLGYGVGAMWMISLSSLPFLITLMKLNR